MTAPGPGQAPAQLHAIIANTIRRAGPGTYGITGPAGVGKTYVATRVAADLQCGIYSADYAFIGSSAERKLLLAKKQLRSVDAYKDAVNQFNWWDWGTILSHLDDLQSGSSVEIAAPYDRTTGDTGAALTIPATDVLIYEGALFGPPFLVTRLKQIFFLWADPKVRFQRLVEKDQGRRSFNEIIARFLITEYSETQYYRRMLQWAEGKVVFLDSLTGLPCRQPNLLPKLFIPLPVSFQPTDD
jgi:uridine kinase